MTGLIEQSGGAPQKQPKYVPIFMDRAFTGLYTQRSVLHDPSDIYTARYYGGRPDALWMGSNIELTNNLTLKRRPGLTPFSSATYPTPPNRAFSFQLSNGAIQVIIDTGSSGNFVLTSVDNASGGNTVYHGTITGGAANAYAGLIFTVAGFVTPQNNGTFTCTASTATTITLSNPGGTSETDPATVFTAGAVYVDNQNGTKTFLFAKSPGAGQTQFVAVAGVLYMGDGVDTKKYTPLNTNGILWNWGIVAPPKQPNVTIVQSGSAAAVWSANTVFSTMGLVFDSGTNTIQQLNSVNASGTNTTQIGTTGTGAPAWDQTPGNTTVDNTITWQNRGPISLWKPLSQFQNASTFGTAAAPCIIYDPVTKSCYIQANSNPGLRTSGSTYPAFKAGAGQKTQDGQVVWFYIGTPGIPGTWLPGHAYPTVGTQTQNDAVSSIAEPVGLQNGLPSNQTVFWQVALVGGTSAASAVAPNFGTVSGTLTGADGDNIWMSLGSGVWSASQSVFGWTASGTPFNAVKDSNGNFQVCITSGTTATIQPGTSFTLSAVGNSSGGNATYTGTFSPTIPVGTPVVISGFTTSANNGTFTVVSCSSTQLVVNNASAVAETHAATAVYNPWGAGYGVTTTDGTAVWTCVGIAMTWAASTKWYLPAVGFAPPSTSQAFGGASVNDSNNDVEFIVNSGKSGGSQPTWNGIGQYTADGGTALTLTQVSVTGTTTTYLGTITGGGSNALAGQMLVVAGFTNAGNNGLVIVTSSSATQFTVMTTSQVNETHAATATENAIWYNLRAATANSLSWTKGYAYAYSFKARSLDDPFSPLPLGGGQVPPGVASPLGAPTGSETEAISTASPAFIITGPNTGAVNTVSGLGSTDPQVDTIVIWRSADGGGSSQMFELTEIPAPKPIGGIAQPWSFQDFLPDTPTSVFPGLDQLIPAPINDQNNPPPSTFLPMVYNFQRIWGANGQSVPFSGGPDVLAGNPNEAFSPADELPFLAPVVRLVRTSQGIVTFLTDSIEVIAGGPATTSFFSVTMAPGIGLLSYNALDVYGGEIYFFSPDNQFRTLTPSLNVSNAGFPLGDQFANIPNSGISDATWDPSKVYVTVHQNGIDSAIFVADGSTGWYRLNPHQVPGAAQGPEPIWSPFANITGGCRMVQSVETQPGIKKLLVGATTPSQQILNRNLSVFTDNGTSYDAFFVMGSITLAHPGQISLMKFLEFDFSGVGFTPTISYLLNEISGSFTPFVNNTDPNAGSLVPVPDPPQVYGATTTPSSYSPNRYYFGANAQLARCRHLQIKVDLGTNANGNEMYSMTIFGRLMVET